MKDFNIDQIEDIDDIPPSYLRATINKIGGLEKWKRLMRGNFSVELKEAIRLLFDRNGRFIPFSALKIAICDPNPNFHFKQPEINYGEILERIRRHLAVGLGQEPLDIGLASVGEFEERTLAVKAKLDTDPRTINATKGIWLPIALPQLQLLLSENNGDYGALLNQFVAGVASAYAEDYPNRSFTNYRQNDLTGNVSIFPGSRHDRLITEMVKGTVVGIVLLPFGGYSVNACREIWSGHELFSQILNRMFLGGGLDVAIAYMAFAKELCRDNNTPIVRCPAVNWRSYSLQFDADYDAASFDNTVHLVHTDGNYSGAVFCLG
ncbi:hypothetical protein HZA71_00725 [Candidatus Falkowbacteria bacterium]|nr:hypothetical protein [Candidatus Falkowbacteria bacterium]